MCEWGTQGEKKKESSCQDVLREMKVFNPIFQYLTVGIDQIDEDSMYSESVIRYLLDLLSKAIDTNRLN